MNNKFFTVANAGNTCYIDSILMSLFFSPSPIEYLLDTDTKTDYEIYLQESIKNNFIYKIRKGYSINTEIINTIKNICINCGWLKHMPDEHDAQQDINEFYTFLMEIFNGQLIEVQRITSHIGLIDDSDIGTIEKIPFIQLIVPKNTTDSAIKVKDMLNSWINDNFVDIQRKILIDGVVENKTIRGTNKFNIVNRPSVIAFVINRFKLNGERDYTMIDIQSKIVLPNNDFLCLKNKWLFHSAICHHGSGQTNLKNGHYYSLIHHQDKYYIFDDLQVPALREISMNNSSITNIIKRECVFILYKIII